VPINSISDSSKSLNSFKSAIKGTTSVNYVNGTSSVSSNATATTSTTTASNSSSNQLTAIGSNDTESATYFSTANFTNITAQVGSIVEIPCTVHHLGEGTVSCKTHKHNGE